MQYYATCISIKGKKQEHQHMEHYLEKKFFFRNQNYPIRIIKTIDKTPLKEKQHYQQPNLPCKRHYIWKTYIINWLIGY